MRTKSGLSFGKWTWAVVLASSGFLARNTSHAALPEFPPDDMSPLSAIVDRIRSARAEASRRKQERKKAPQEPVVVDFSGSPGMDGSGVRPGRGAGFPGERGSDGAGLIVGLRLDESRRRLSILAYDVENPYDHFKDEVDHPRTIVVRSRGGAGGDGANVKCPAGEFESPGAGGPGADGGRLRIYYNDPEVLNGLVIENEGGKGGRKGSQGVNCPQGTSWSTDGEDGAKGEVTLTRGEPPMPKPPFAWP